MSRRERRRGGRSRIRQNPEAEAEAEAEAETSRAGGRIGLLLLCTHPAAQARHGDGLVAYCGGAPAVLDTFDRLSLC